MVVGQTPVVGEVITEQRTMLDLLVVIVVQKRYSDRLRAHTIQIDDHIIPGVLEFPEIVADKLD